MRGVVIRILYLRTWGKLHYLVTRPRSTWSFLLCNRETANFTYGLANEGELPAFISDATELPVTQLDAYLRELAADDEFHQWLRTKVIGGTSPGRAPVGRRVG